MMSVGPSGQGPGRPPQPLVPRGIKHGVSEAFLNCSHPIPILYQLEVVRAGLRRTLRDALACFRLFLAPSDGGSLRVG
jgi:hypothetical protein